MKLSEYFSKKGIRQIFFAEQIRYTHQYLNSIVRGRRKPSRQFIEAVEIYTKKNPYKEDDKEPDYVSKKDWYL